MPPKLVFRQIVHISTLQSGIFSRKTSLSNVSAFGAVTKLEEFASKLEEFASKNDWHSRRFYFFFNSKKLHEKSCCYIVVWMEKSISQRQGKRDFDSVRSICNLHSCSTFAPVLHDKSTRFSQSEARKCFMYIFSIGNNMISSAI